MKSNTFNRYIIVGIINTLVGTSIMFIVYNILGGSYWISTFLNYFIGSIVSYLLNKYYTFKQFNKSIREVISFILNIAICYFISYYAASKLIAYLLKGYSLVLVDNISMMVGMVLFVILNYMGQKYFVFNKRYSSAE